MEDKKQAKTPPGSKSPRRESSPFTPNRLDQSNNYVRSRSPTSSGFDPQQSVQNDSNMYDHIWTVAFKGVKEHLQPNAFYILNGGITTQTGQALSELDSTIDLQIKKLWPDLSRSNLDGVSGLKRKGVERQRFLTPHELAISLQTEQLEDQAKAIAAELEMDSDQVLNALVDALINAEKHKSTGAIAQEKFLSKWAKKLGGTLDESTARGVLSDLIQKQAEEKQANTVVEAEDQECLQVFVTGVVQDAQKRIKQALDQKTTALAGESAGKSRSPRAPRNPFSRESEDFQLLNYIEKVIYLTIVLGTKLSKTTQSSLNDFITQVLFDKTEHANIKEFTKKFPLLLYKLVTWDTLEKFHTFDRHLVKVLKPFRDTFAAVISFSNNPIYEAVVAATVLSEMMNLGSMLQEDVEDARRTVLNVLKAGMSADGMDDPSLAFKVLMYDSTVVYRKNHESNPLKQPSILGLALEYNLGEFLSLPQSQAVVDHIWYGELYDIFAVDVSKSIRPATNFSDIWQNLLLFKVDIWMYRKVPCCYAYTECFFWILFLFLTYATLHYDDHHQDRFSLHHYILLGVACGFTAHEVIQVLDVGLLKYLSSTWNLSDLFISLCFLLWAVCRWRKDIPNKTAYEILALTSLLMLFRVLHYTEIFKRHGIFVAALLSMTSDVMSFMYLFVLILWGFAMTMSSIFLRVPEFHNIQEALLNLFASSMGGFDYSWFDYQLEDESGESYFALSEKQRVVGRLLLTIFVVLASIVLLNMLIAILTETYTRITEHSFQQWSVARTLFVKECQISDAELPPPFSSLTLLFDLFSIACAEKLCMPMRAFLRGCLDYILTVTVMVLPVCVADSFIILKGSFEIMNVQIHRRLLNYTETHSLGLKRFVSFFGTLLTVFCLTLLVAILLIFACGYPFILAYHLVVKLDPLGKQKNALDDRTPLMQPGVLPNLTNKEKQIEYQNLIDFQKQKMLQHVKFQVEDVADLIIQLDDKLENLIQEKQETDAEVRKQLVQINQAINQVLQEMEIKKKKTHIQMPLTVVSAPNSPVEKGSPVKKKLW